MIVWNLCLYSEQCVSLLTWISNAVSIVRILFILLLCINCDGWCYGLIENAFTIDMFASCLFLFIYPGELFLVGAHVWFIKLLIAVCTLPNPWASCQMREIAGCAWAGNAANVSPPPRVTDPGMHHSTCVPAISQEAIVFSLEVEKEKTFLASPAYAQPHSQ